MMIALVAVPARLVDRKIRRDAVGVDQVPGDRLGRFQPPGRAQFGGERVHEFPRRLRVDLERSGILPAFAVALPQLGAVPQLRPVGRP
jgi:hypothetical protein